MINTTNTPTRETVEDLRIGDTAPNCFGTGTVTEIHGRGVDVNGRAFVCYYSTWGNGSSTVSGSMKEDTIERTVALTRDHDSAEITDAENQLRKERHV